MKKAYSYAASALLSVLLVSGMAASPSYAETAAAAPKAAAQDAGKTAAPATAAVPAPLPPEKMKMVKDAMEKMHAEVKPLMAQEMGLHKELHELVIAPTFDKDAYLAKHAEAQKVHAQIADVRAKTIADLAGSLAVEERKALPRAMMMSGPMGGMHGPRGEGGMMMHRGHGMKGGAAKDAPADMSSMPDMPAAK